MSRRFTVDVAADQNGGVGFYGCIVSGRGQLVRVAYVGEGKPPRAAAVDCPACGLRHLAQPSWRKPTDADEGLEPDLTIGSEEAVGRG